MFSGKCVKHAVTFFCVVILVGFTACSARAEWDKPGMKEVKFKDLKRGEAQITYENAVEYYLNGNHTKAKPLLEKLIKIYSNNFVYNPYYYERRNPEDHVIIYKSGPSALDMLARIYFRENKKQEAIKYFQEMIRRYPMDYFMTPYENTAYYGGPAGAEGRRYLIDIFLKNPGFAPKNSKVIVSEYEFNKAVALAFDLIKKYGSIDSFCWEDCPTYGDIAAFDILNYLKRMNKPMNVREMYARKFTAASKDDELKANILLKLADDYKEVKDLKNAVGRYKELIIHYPYTYSIDEGSIYLYSLEAYIGILEIYKNNNHPGKSVGELKKEMKKHMENACRKIKNNLEDQIIKRYEKYTE